MNRTTTIMLAAVAAAAIAAVAGLVLLQEARVEDERQAAEWLETGVRLFEEKQYPEALAVLERVPAGSPSEAKAWYYRGSAQMILKDYETAAHYLEHALALDNRDTGTLYALGVVYYKLGNLKLARSYFAAVLEINPDDEQAKGLMDIMANLERETAEPPAGD